MAGCNSTVSDAASYHHASVLCNIQCHISAQASLRPPATLGFLCPPSPPLPICTKQSVSLLRGCFNQSIKDQKNDILKVSTSSNITLSFTRPNVSMSSLLCFAWDCWKPEEPRCLDDWCCAVCRHSAQSPPAHWHTPLNQTNSAELTLSHTQHLKCWENARLALWGSCALKNVNTKARCIHAVSLLCGTAIFWRSCKAMDGRMNVLLRPAITSLYNTQRTCWPTLPLVEHQFFTPKPPHDNPPSHTNTNTRE